MPGSTPATSQLDWLISITAMIVLFWSRATRDLLKSFGWGIAALHRLHAATKLPFPRRPPHSFSRSPGDTPQRPLITSPAITFHESSACASHQAGDGSAVQYDSRGATLSPASNTHACRTGGECDFRVMVVGLARGLTSEFAPHNIRVN